MRSIILIVALGALLLGAVFAALETWSGLGDVDMPWQGWLALIAGVILTLALGIGLMLLVFYSARHGHDDVHYDQQQRDETPPDSSDPP